MQILAVDDERLELNALTRTLMQLPVSRKRERSFLFWKHAGGKKYQWIMHFLISSCVE